MSTKVQNPEQIRAHHQALAEHYAALAELEERQGEARRYVRLDSPEAWEVREVARRHDAMAQSYRRTVRYHLCIAIEHTDYTPPSDLKAEAFYHRLSELAAAARPHALDTRDLARIASDANRRRGPLAA